MGKLRLRETYIRDYEHLPNSGSRSYPINIIDPIPDLYFKFTARNYTVSNVKNCLYDIVNEIEVIDGSDVLFSLKPREILAMNAYHYKESMHWGINELPNAYQECIFKIPFGLGRYDPTLSFDPTKFKNPQIRFSWDLENIYDVDTWGFLDDSLYVDIIATVAERYPARPAGFLMHKHIVEWMTTNTGSIKRVEMPVDYPHRTVFLTLLERYKDHELTDCPWTVLEKAKYNIDQQKYIPFDWHTDDWMMWLKEFYGMWHQGADYFLSAGTGIYRYPCLPANLALGIVQKQSAGGAWWSQGTGCKVYTSAGTSVGTFKVHHKMDGTLPFNTWAYPFGDPGDIEEWLQVRDIGKIYFEIKQDIEDEKARVFLSQYRTY